MANAELAVRPYPTREPPGNAVTNVEVRAAGNSVGSARIGQTGSGADGEVWISFRVATGSAAPPDARRRIVDTAFARAAQVGARRVHVSVALGDTDLIWLVCSHCANPQTRAAGTTCLIDADLNPQTTRGDGAANSSPNAGPRAVPDRSLATAGHSATRTDPPGS